MSRPGDVHDLLSDDLDLANVNYLLQILSYKKQKLEAVKFVSFLVLLCLFVLYRL